jgi:hypothetical protein
MMLLVFGAGLVVGILAGVFVMALLVAGRDGSERQTRVLEASE